jgi:hypothetical protein
MFGGGLSRGASLAVTLEPRAEDATMKEGYEGIVIGAGMLLTAMVLIGIAKLLF